MPLPGHWGEEERVRERDADNTADLRDARHYLPALLVVRNVSG